MQEMFDLRVFQIINKSSRSITKSSLHRWNIYDNSKFLNCDEKMRRCHSMNFEDYSPDINYLKKIENTEEIRGDQIGVKTTISEYQLGLHR